jgi:hypothetical protein
MIVFTCSQCGRRHQRPESAAGTLLYCPCGQANRVPWESTVAEPEPPARAEKPLEAEPVDAPPRPREDRPWRPARRRPARRRTDPAFCFNHPTAPSRHPCADCGESFCGLCLVTLQEQFLCGPCKNFRLGALQRPANISGLALTSMLVALVTSPVVFCLTIVPAFASEGQPLWPLLFDLVCVCAPVTALFLGWKALRDIESRPRVGGRVMAITGMTTATVGLLWCLAVAWVAVLHGLGQ